MHQLQKSGLKSTPARQALISSLEEFPGCSEEKLLSLIQEKSHVNTSTLYRAMHDLLSAGVIHDIRWDQARYFFLCTLESHEHATTSYCTNCREIREYNTTCSHKHPNLLSDTREIIVSCCQNCPQ